MKTHSAKKYKKKGFDFFDKVLYFVDVMRYSNSLRNKQNAKNTLKSTVIDSAITRRKYFQLILLEMYGKSSKNHVLEKVHLTYKSVIL